MTDQPNDYLALARVYVDGAQALLTPSGQPSGERGATGPSSYTELELQADALAPVSDQLTERAAELLEDPSAGVRSDGEIRLLAKAQSDLEIGAYLLQAAFDQADEMSWQAGDGAERSARSHQTAREPLNLLVADLSTISTLTERGETAPPTDLPTARTALATAVEDTLAVVTQRAGRTGQAALTGLVGMGLGEVAQAAGVVGMDIAEALGKVEQVSRLYEHFRGFAVKSYDALVALLGPGIAQTAANQVVTWVQSVQEGEQFGNLIERLYQTGATQEELAKAIQASEASLEKFGTGIESVGSLAAVFGKKATQADELVKKLKFVGVLPAAVLPQGRVLLAAAYIVLGGYVVLAGADYVDAQTLRLLNRVPGVRQLVGESLAPESEGSE